MGHPIYPKLELLAKSFAIECCARKSADFTSLDLAIFIDQKYYQLANIIKNKDTNLVQWCGIDLRR